MTITNLNRQDCPILGQPSLVIAYIADKLEQGAKIDFKNLAAHSKEKICTYARTLSAFMRSCKTINSKAFLQEKMRLLKREICLSDWNIKYPLFANSWNPRSNKDVTTLFSIKYFKHADSINDKFSLIRQPYMILEVIRQAYPKEMGKFEQDLDWQKDRKKLIETTSALLQSCKALYNCKTLKKFHEELKEKYLLYTGKFIKFGNKIYNYPGGPGWLNEIFLTGWINSYSGGKADFVGDRSWDKTYEEDTKQIVKLYPESLLCRTLGLRLRDRVAPFSMACMNEQVPVSTIKFLLENGANPNESFGSHGKECHWTDTYYYINDNDAQTRFEEIVDMVETHSLNFRTKIVVNYDTGFGKNLFIRGSGFGLSWDKGVPLINLSANSWSHVIPWIDSVGGQSTPNFEYKILIDDLVWEKDVSETEQNHKGKNGEQISIVPNF